MSCFLFPQFRQLSGKICSMTCDCCLSKEWENINACTEALGTWHGVAGKSPRRTNSSCLNAVMLYCVGEKKKKTQKVFYSLHLQVKFPHWSGERGVLAMRFHCQAGMAFCTVTEKKRWSFGWGKQLGGTLKVRQSRPGQVNCSSYACCILSWIVLMGKLK